MGWRTLWGTALAFALALGAAPAAADEAPSPAKVEVKRSAAKRPFASRPVVVGLLAALFLVVAGAAGANDKKS